MVVEASWMGTGDDGEGNCLMESGSTEFSHIMWYSQATSGDVNVNANTVAFLFETS